jgi:adenosylcobinamide-phosphate guanylyltransferase
MLALIMAGGQGTRLSLGEKPLVTVCKRPMIEYVLQAFSNARMEVVVVLTAKTPYTANWCRVNGVDTLTTGGGGYIEDLVEAVLELEENGPLFTSVSDLPCLLPDTILQVRSSYFDAGMDACSTWIPATLLAAKGISQGFFDTVNGVDSCAAGLNILRGDRIQEEQEEYRLLCEHWDLALHVNTRTDLALATRALCPAKENPSER